MASVSLPTLPPGEGAASEPAAALEAALFEIKRVIAGQDDHARARARLACSPAATC